MREETDGILKTRVGVLKTTGIKTIEREKKKEKRGK